MKRGATYCYSALAQLPCSGRHCRAALDHYFRTPGPIALLRAGCHYKKAGCQHRTLNWFSTWDAQICHLDVLVAPSCATPRDYLSDTPLKPPILSVSPLESMRSGGAIPAPPTKGVSQRYLRDTLWKQGKMRAIPLCDALSRKGIARYGGVSSTGPLPRPLKKITYAKKIPEELFSGWLRHFRVINYAKELSENDFLGSDVNFA